MKIPPWIQASLGIVFAATGMWFFLKNVNGQQLWVELHNFNLFAVLVCACLPIFSLWLRSVRLRLILPTSPGSNTKKLMDSVLIEFSVNNILPGRIGEVARALLLWKRNGFSAMVSIGSIVVERMFDMLIIFSFFFLPVFFISDLHSQVFSVSLWSVQANISLLSIAWCLFAIFLLGFVAIMLYRIRPQMVRYVSLRFIKILPSGWRRKVRVLGAEVFVTVKFLFSFRRLLGVIFLSIGIEAAYAASFLLLIAPLSVAGIFKSMFAQAFGCLGAAIPLTPGFIGTLHAMLLQGFSFAGFELEKSRATTIIYHALGMITVTPLGLFLLAKSNIRFGTLLKAPKPDVDSAIEEQKDS